MKSINAANPAEAVPEDLLGRSFEACWPNLEAALKRASLADASDASTETGATPGDFGKLNDILQELLLLARSQAQLLSSPQAFLPLDQLTEALERTRRRRHDVPDRDHPVWRDVREGLERLRALSELLPPGPEADLVRRVSHELDKPLRFVLREFSVGDTSIREISRDRIREEIIEALKKWTAEVTATPHQEPPA